MDWYNLVFFHIFKRYYKDGKYKNDIPWLTVSFILGASSYLYLLSMFLWFYYFFIDQNIPHFNNKIITILGMANLAINYYWFTYKHRYIRIYEKYKDSNKNNRITDIIAWLYVIMGFVQFAFSVVILKQ